MNSIARRSQRNNNIWPGFVDALATLLMVIIFLLMIFVIAQFFLNEAISGRDKALDNLNSQISELSEMLSMERLQSDDLRSDVAKITDQLQASLLAQDELSTTIRALSTRTESAEDKVKSLTDKLTGEREKSLQQVKEISTLADKVSALIALRDQLETQVSDLLKRSETAEQTLTVRDETISEQISEMAALALNIKSLTALKKQLEAEISKLASRTEETEDQLLAEIELSSSARAEVALLTQQMEALRIQMAQISAALEASEEFNREQKAEIHSLGQRLNAALATKVMQLSKYRSEFFGRLREILGNTAGIQIVGDRFVLQSELLFEQGSADIGETGKKQMEHLAATLKDLATRIPDDIDWVLRIDGHTDTVPIYNFRFPSNWELSAARAISVVKYLIAAGLPPRHLAATGFGEFQPLALGKDPETLRLNRRIELKLTQR
ncbi:MAG: peptidoglycan -binding protein [Rhodospirillales bacterium]|jgi:chemotaxis protein MotB|nr:peptidoglycan -binding protein [Rhodospirillales bacterium]